LSGRSLRIPGDLEVIQIVESDGLAGAGSFLANKDAGRGFSKNDRSKVFQHGYPHCHEVR